MYAGTLHCTFGPSKERSIVLVTTPILPCSSKQLGTRTVSCPVCIHACMDLLQRGGEQGSRRAFDFSPRTWCGVCTTVMLGFPNARGGTRLWPTMLLRTRPTLWSCSWMACVLLQMRYSMHLELWDGGTPDVRCPSRGDCHRISGLIHDMSLCSEQVTVV